MRPSFDLGPVAKLPQRVPVRVQLGGRELAVVRIGRRVYAIDGECPHAGGPLAAGSVRGPCISCPWHGWSFDLRTGQCQTVPGVAVEWFPVRVAGGTATVEIEPREGSIGLTGQSAVS